VEDFVGGDRALKALALKHVRDIELLPAREGATGPEIAPGALLRDALSALIAHEAHYAPVVEDGRVVGVITVELISRAIAEDA
jgi:CBS domain-containing protein